MRLGVVIGCILLVLDIARAVCPTLDVVPYLDYCASQSSVFTEHLGTEYVVDLLQHVDGNNMTQIPGSNPHSTAYQLKGSKRHLEVESATVDTALEMLKKHKEFSILTAVKQKPRSTGSIISFTTNGNRYLEVESNGRKNEIRIHYAHRRRTRSEVFPYLLADNQWHNVALSISKRSVKLYIDCNKVYEKSIRRIRDIIYGQDLHIWLCQRNHRQAFFKGAIEYVKLVASPQGYGYREQCPHASEACPTCSQFSEIESKVQEQSAVIERLRQELAAAKKRISEFEQCQCRQSCDVQGVEYADGKVWTVDRCTNCTCENGDVKCKGPVCPPVSCDNPVTKDNECCPYCPNQPPSQSSHIVPSYKTGVAGHTEDCHYQGQIYKHGAVKFTNCEKTYVCRDGRMVFELVRCPELDCPESRQYQRPGQCCKICREFGVGSEASSTGQGPCHSHSTCHQDAHCVDLVLQHVCACNDGYDGNGTHCTDRDECQMVGGHYGHHCHSNTLCVNTPGSYYCDCLPGFTKTGTSICEDLDECTSGTHQCNRNADCINTQGGYTCQCHVGFEGDGRHCQLVCEQPCPEGHLCIAPGRCACPQGFTGLHCQQDLNECELSMDKCHANSVCVNIPGFYYCKCKPGFYYDFRDNRLGTLCTDVDECQGWGGEPCPTGTACVNTVGSYKCECMTPGNCRIDEQNEKALCSTVTCDCRDPNVDLRCCPHCHPRKTCLHQDGVSLHHEGEEWVYKCQRCRCLKGIWPLQKGRLECGPLACPVLTCDAPLPLQPGQCCPRCHPDPCLASEPVGQAGAVCHFNNMRYASGAKWHIDRCTQCTCKAGHVCCSYQQNCSLTQSPDGATRSRGRDVASFEPRRLPFAEDSPNIGRPHKHDDGG